MMKIKNRGRPRHGLRLVWILWPATALALAAQTPAPGGSPASFAWHREPEAVALLKDGRPVWRLNYSPRLASKPFFHPVALPGGSPLTWASPPDHRWHYALWFSWKYLNKVNYWEENQDGIPDGSTVLSKIEVDSRPDFSAQVAMELLYHSRDSNAVVLTEKRAIRISTPAADGSYQMDWRLEFTAGNEDVVMDRTPPDTAPDGNPRGGYAGLSVRLTRDLARPRVTATTDIGSMQKNRYGFAATAADFNGEINGAEAGIAFLDHPSNPRFPTRWYAITNAAVPFWYLNSCWLQLEPYTLPAKGKLNLRYRVLIHPQRWDAARLKREHARYAREAAGAPSAPPQP